MWELFSASPIHTVRQFVRFCVVGIVNTAVDLVLYFILTRYLGFSGSLIYAAKALSYSVATFNSFALNRAWTFGRQGRYEAVEIARFYIFVGSGIFVNIGVHFIDVQMLGVNDIVSSAIAALCTAVWGFTFAKLFVFR